MSTTVPNRMVVAGPDLPAHDATADADALGLPKERMGIPVAYFWKPMVSADTRYSHPNPKYGDLLFTKRDLSEAERWTKEFIKDGGAPFIPVGHGAKDNQGFIHDAKFDGRDLWGLHGFVGRDAVEKAAKHKTSVALARKFKGGNGKTYDIIVEHNALVADPVAMGLGDYVALSRESGGPAENVPVYTPAAQLNRSPAMPTLSPEEVEKAREILGQPELPEDQVFAVMLSATATALNDVDAAIGERDEARGERDTAVTELSRVREDLEVITLSRDDARTELKRATNPPPVDPEALNDRADNYLSRIELSMRDGDIPRPIAERLKAAVKRDGKPNTFMLSRAEQLDGRPVDFVLDLFKGAKLGVPTGEQSPGAHLLSREVPGERKDDGGYDQKFVNELAAKVSPKPLNGNGNK